MQYPTGTYHALCGSFPFFVHNIAVQQYAWDYLCEQFNILIDCKSDLVIAFFWNGKYVFWRFSAKKHKYTL